jgi:uncharacterized protein (DUF2384 family)
MAHAVDTFGDQAKAQAWLTTPNLVLSNLQRANLIIVLEQFQG